MKVWKLKTHGLTSCIRFADYGCMLEILTLELLPDGRSYVDTVGGSRFKVLKRGQRDGYHTADIEYLEDQKVRVTKVTNVYNTLKVLRRLDPCSSSLSVSVFQLYGTELERLQHLHDSVYQQTQDWYQRLGSRTREQIDRQYGTLPEKEENIQVWAQTETFKTTKTHISWSVSRIVTLAVHRWYSFPSLQSSASVSQASPNGPAWCWWLLSVLQLDPSYKTTILSLTTLKDRLGHLRMGLEYFSQR